MFDLGVIISRTLSTTATVNADAAATPKKTKFGNLSDSDRIFTNLYGRHDWKLKVIDLSLD